MLCRQSNNIDLPFLPLASDNAGCAQKLTLENEYPKDYPVLVVRKPG